MDVKNPNSATHHVIGGGTISHVRSHIALTAPAYGQAARTIHEILKKEGIEAQLHLTKMASAGASNLETNEDVAQLTDDLVSNPDTKMIFFNAAMTDFNGQIGEILSGKYAPRLQSRSEDQLSIKLSAADKVLPKIRKDRKDIFVVGFKATSGMDEDEQYMQGLRLLKTSSVNLVLANDTVTRTNMVIVPEEARYHVTKDRREALEGLVRIALARSNLNFTRSTVLKNESLVPWNSNEIPDNLRNVVNYLINRGVYQPFLGKTAGHFAVRGRLPGEFLTSARKTDFNQLPENGGLVRVFTQGRDSVIAHGARPSVGGQSQRIVFEKYPQLNSIVHFHASMKENIADPVPLREQWRFECGSHECGENTRDGLKEIEPGIYAVMLEKHGPNIVFNRDVPAERVISFMDRNFDLGQKTGGNIAPAYR